MHALWELGEDDAYFRDIALRWREDEWNARVAMNVLALSPTSENLAASRQVADEATSGLLTGAYSVVTSTANQIARYEALRSPQEKADFAPEYAIGGWSGSSGRYVGVGIHNGGLQPRFINGRKWLRELSEEHPDLVARAIAEFSAAESEFITERIESVRDHFAHFISPEAQEILARLREAQ